MKYTNRFSAIILLLTVTHLLQCYDVTTLMPFGNTSQEISTNIKSLVTQKQSLIDSLNQHFEKQEKEILETLRCKYNIPEEEWLLGQILFKEHVDNDPLFNSTKEAINHDFNDHHLIKKTRELIQEYDLNPAAVSVENTKNVIAGVITYTKDSVPHHTLFINISELETLPLNQTTAIIRHEIMHIRFSDNLKRQIYVCLFKCKKIDIYTDPLFADFCKNSEMRADVNASIHSTDTLLSLMNFFGSQSWIEFSEKNNSSYIQKLTNWIKKRFGIHKNEFEKHPSDAERIEILKKLYTYLKEEQNCQIPITQILAYQE